MTDTRFSWLDPHIGATLLDIDEHAPLVETVTTATMRHLFTLRDQGTLDPIPVRDPDRILFTRIWNDFVTPPRP